MVKRLTPKGIEKMSVNERVELSDPECPGLRLRVTPRGRKSFYGIFTKPDGKRVREKIGAWPGVSLVDARERYRDIQERGFPTSELTFADVVDRYIDWQQERGRRTWHLQQRQMELHVLPSLGDKRTDQIRKADLYDLLRQLDKKGPSVGENVFSILRAIFTWAERRDWARHNPATVVWADVQRTKPRDRILRDKELAAIWLATDFVHPAARDLVRMLILLGQRRTETSLMRDIDVRDGIWTIPADVAKSNRQHDVPLSEPALRIVQTRNSRPFIFSSDGGHAPVSGFSKVKRVLDKEAGFDDWTYHDLRRTMTTRMAEIGIPDHVVDRLLNHSVARSTRARHYDRYSYEKEKAAALEEWASYLSNITLG
ncbi:MAG: tyrosine-type recombinase/integrase [Pseudomonadota bacterium]